MTVTRIVGVILIVIGLVGLLFGGVFWTREKTVLDIGPVEAKTPERDGGPSSPVVGGVIVAALDPSYLTRIYNTVNTGADGFIRVVGVDGVVRATRPLALGGRERPGVDERAQQALLALPDADRRGCDVEPRAHAVFTPFVNHAMAAAISIPCGSGRDGLPVGLQLVGGYFQEGRLLGVAHRFQEATEWHRRRPKVYL